MSNPIADTAEYFSENEHRDNQNLRPVALHIFPSQNLSSAPEDLLSPESPESRRPQIKQNEFDPKLQWKRALKRLPINRHYEDSSSISSSSSDTNERQNIYEMHGLDKSKQSYLYEQDDSLPNANDIQDRTYEKLNTDDNFDEERAKKEEDDKNFFKHPFDEQQKHAQGILSPEDPSSTTSMFPTVDAAAAEQQREKGKAKKHWGATLDKVRLIANLHTLPRQQKVGTQMTSSVAPYYPPLFDPLFIAMSKDNHGHCWVK